MPSPAASARHLPSGNELRALETELREHFPVAAAMDVRVAGVDESGLVLGAPLARNVNPKGTAFAGSLYALATLAGWGVVRLLTRASHLDCDIVIQESAVSYLKPVETDFEAICAPPDTQAWSRFATTLERKGKARIALDVSIHQDRDLALRFRGVYVALSSS